MSATEYMTPALWHDEDAATPPAWWDAGEGHWVFYADPLNPRAVTIDDTTPRTLPAGTVIDWALTALGGPDLSVSIYFYSSINGTLGDLITQIDLTVDANEPTSGQHTVETDIEGVLSFIVATSFAFPSGDPTLAGTVHLSFEDQSATPPADPDEVLYNCECQDTNDADTLEESRRKLLIKCGFAAVVDNPPPGVADLMNLFLEDAQKFLYHKYPALRTRRYFRWALRENVRYYGMRENDENWDTVGVALTTGDPGVVTFNDTAPVAGREIQFWATPDSELPSEITAYQRYFVVSPSGNTCSIAETAGGDPIAFTADGLAYAMYSPADSCVFNMEPYKNIEGAWLEDVNGTWLPLASPIPGTFYTTVTQPGMPVRYEIRQCVEIFPAPNSNDYKLWLKGHFGLSRYTEDGDQPTIDGQLVYLWALADALAYYGKAAAASAKSDAREYLGGLVAGTHGTKRYVPGTTPIPPAVMPTLLPLPGE